MKVERAYNANVVRKSIYTPCITGCRMRPSIMNITVLILISLSLQGNIRACFIAWDESEHDYFSL